MNRFPAEYNGLSNRGRDALLARGVTPEKLKKTEIWQVISWGVGKKDVLYIRRNLEYKGPRYPEETFLDRLPWVLAKGLYGWADEDPSVDPREFIRGLSEIEFLRTPGIGRKRMDQLKKIVEESYEK